MSVASGMVTSMERKIWMAAELEAMTPAERQEISRTCETLDPSDFPKLQTRRVAARDLTGESMGPATSVVARTT